MSRAEDGASLVPAEALFEFDRHGADLAHRGGVIFSAGNGDQLIVCHVSHLEAEEEGVVGGEEGGGHVSVVLLELIVHLGERGVKCTTKKAPRGEPVLLVPI